MLFYNFSRRVMENTLVFCNPSRAFRGTLIPNQSSTQNHDILALLLTFYLKWFHFAEMEWKLVLLGKSGARAGRGPKTSTKPMGFLGILRCQSLIFGDFHVKW